MTTTEEEKPNNEVSEISDHLGQIQNITKENLINSQQMVEFEETIDCVSNDWRTDLLAEAEMSSSQDPIVISDSDTEVETDISPVLTISGAIDRLNEIESFTMRETPEMLFHLNQLKNK